MLFKEAKRRAKVEKNKTTLRQAFKGGNVWTACEIKNACSREQVTALFWYVCDTNEGTCTAEMAAYACKVQVCHV